MLVRTQTLPHFCLSSQLIYVKSFSSFFSRVQDVSTVIMPPSQTLPDLCYKTPCTLLVLKSVTTEHLSNVTTKMKSSCWLDIILTLWNKYFTLSSPLSGQMPDSKFTIDHIHFYNFCTICKALNGILLAADNSQTSPISHLAFEMIYHVQSNKIK